MFNFFRRGPRPEVSTDAVIPLHYCDDVLIFRNLVQHSLFAFDDVLDPQLLRGSLERVVERDGWRKIGGRLRKNRQGTIEYHVPQCFSAERPAVDFSHVHHDVTAASHPVGSKIPKPTGLDTPAVVGDPAELSDLIRAPGAPRCLNDYLTSDCPVLSVYVTTFTDKTVLVLSWPHLAFDLEGKRAIMDAWILSMQGREAEIQTPIGFDVDPLAELGRHATEKHVLADRRLSTTGMLAWALRNISLLLYPKESRMVCIPAAFWQKMRETALAELATEAPEVDGCVETGKPPFLSEGDILTAWLTRLWTSHLGSDSSTTVSTGNLMSLRKTLRDDLLPAKGPFVSNALAMVTVVAPAHDVLGKPLSWLASQVRQSIAEQGTRGQIEAWVALIRDFSPNLRLPPLFGDNGMYWLTLSNWQRAGLFQLDFSAARASNAPGGGSKGSLRPSYIQPCSDVKLPQICFVPGKDERGNYWATGYLPKGAWAKVERELARQLAAEVKQA